MTGGGILALQRMLARPGGWRVKWLAGPVLVTGTIQNGVASGPYRGYLPMQNREKISPSKSSEVNSPVIRLSDS